MNYEKSELQPYFKMSFQMHFVIVNSLDDLIRKTQHLFKIHFKLFSLVYLVSKRGRVFLDSTFDVQIF